MGNVLTPEVWITDFWTKTVPRPACRSWKQETLKGLVRSARYKGVEMNRPRFVLKSDKGAAQDQTAILCDKLGCAMVWASCTPSLAAQPGSGSPCHPSWPLERLALAPVIQSDDILRADCTSTSSKPEPGKLCQKAFRWSEQYASHLEVDWPINN